MKNLSVLTALAVTIGMGIFVLAPDEVPAVQDAATVAAQEAAASTGSVQPIAFPHDTHAGTYQMDCMYCHFSAERSVDAGIPPVSLCMGCHTLVTGQTNPEEVAKLAEYYARGEPIPWVRIYKISDHAHYPHMRHINAGLDCTQCHGDVASMGPIEERDPAWGGANMGWCVSCHIEMEARRDCTVCHY